MNEIDARTSAMLQREARATPPSAPRAGALLRGAVKRAGVSVVAPYAMICLLMMAIEPSLIYQPPPVAANFAPNPAWNAEDAWFKSSDGTRLHGVLLPYADAERVVLYCHGNAANVQRSLAHMQALRELLRAHVFVFDYRGYGLSDGSPFEEGVIEDGLAAQRWLADRVGCEPNDIIVVGRSLGGAVAVAIAQRQGARGLVLQNTFCTLCDVAAAQYPWLPVRWLIRNRYPSETWIANYSGPLLQSHGTADGLVPLAMGRRLFDACASEDRQFFTIDGGGHNGAEPAEYDALLVDWVERVASGRPAALHSERSPPLTRIPVAPASRVETDRP